MGDAQRLSPEEQIAFAREQFENADDFTVAIEEEFAVLDPDTLEMANRFEELQSAARGTAVEDHLVGELIASEVEVRTGRCQDFTEAAAVIGERFTFPLLADITGLAELSTARALEELVRRNVLAAVGEQFGFVHERIRVCGTLLDEAASRAEEFNSNSVPELIVRVRRGSLPTPPHGELAARDADVVGLNHSIRLHQRYLDVLLL